MQKIVKYSQYLIFMLYVFNLCMYLQRFEFDKNVFLIFQSLFFSFQVSTTQTLEVVESKIAGEEPQVHTVETFEEHRLGQEPATLTVETTQVQRAEEDPSTVGEKTNIHKVSHAV